MPRMSRLTPRRALECRWQQLPRVGRSSGTQVPRIPHPTRVGLSLLPAGKRVVAKKINIHVTKVLYLEFPRRETAFLLTNELNKEYSFDI